MNQNEHVHGGPGEGDVVALNACARREGLSFLEAIPDEMLDPLLVAKLPVEWARSNGLLPVTIDGSTCVLTSDPNHIDAQENLALLLGCELQPVVAPPEAIARAIERCYYQRDDSAREFLRNLEDDTQSVEAVATESSDLLEDATKAPVTQFVNLVLLGAVKRGASDIHFEPFASRLRVRYRVDGVLYEQESPPKRLEQSLVSRLKVMARMDIAENRLPQDGMARVRVGEREIDIRVSTIPVAAGERVVLRILDRDSALLPLVGLGMQEAVSSRFEGLLMSPHGIVIVAGPTGSGKTTTLYAALRKLDASRRNILTIEDPVEYRLPDIGQMQVKPKIGLTFAAGLRHILRQDPDVVLVGETRDAETASIAVRASLTGHLVFTTLHTNDAAGAVVRLVDIGVEPYLLASSLRGILAQRLVRRLCPQCRRETSVTPESLADATALTGLIDAGERVWEPVGCGACIEGYRGRTGVFELIAIDGQIQELIRRGGSSAKELRDLASEHGLAGLLVDGVEKVRTGITSIAEVMHLAMTVG